MAKKEASAPAEPAAEPALDVSEVEPNQAGTPAPVEELNPAGTAPAVPDQGTVADAHALHEQQKARAEAAEAAKWEAIRNGASPTEARDAARAKAREMAALPGAPENKVA